MISWQDQTSQEVPREARHIHQGLNLVRKALRSEKLVENIFKFNVGNNTLTFETVQRFKWTGVGSRESFITGFRQAKTR